MKISVLLMASVFALGGCSKSGGSASLPAPFPAPAPKPESSLWQVTFKSCNDSEQALKGSEKIQLDDGFFAHIYLAYDNASMTCNEALVFSRAIQSSSVAGGQYTETSVLQPSQKRRVCREKRSSATVSDATHPASGGEEMAKLNLNGGRGTVDIHGSEQCPSGNLHLLLKRE